MTTVERFKKEEMEASGLYHTIVDVANREIPTFVAYADIQKRLAAARAEGVEQMKQTVRESAVVTAVTLDKDEAGLYIPASILNP